MGKVTFTIEADTVGEILDEIVRVADRLRASGQNPVPDAQPGEPVTWVPLTQGDTEEAEAERLEARSTKHVERAAEQTKARRGRPPKSNGRAEPEPEPAAKKAKPEPEAEPRKEVTYDDVSEIALRVFQHGEDGKARVIELKNELKINKFTELRPEHYDHAFNRLTQIADELDMGAA